MPDGFKSIKDIFYSDPGLNKIRAIVYENDVVNDFALIFPDFVKIAQAVKAQNKTLTLKVENAAWRNELKFKEKEILDKINSFYGEERVNKIKFSAK